MYKIKTVEFYKSFDDVRKVPDTDFPEAAFIGKSNVGKSSLINDLCGRKIAAASSTPGRTRLLNYFLINKNTYFVDLPGYGYADTSMKDRKKIEGLIENYLQHRQQIKIIFLLLDIRRIPNDEDRMFTEWLKKIMDVEIFYVLTKTDKLSKSAASSQKIKIALELFIDASQFIMYSIPAKTGRVELLKKLGIILV